jgi:glycosyltransferase involved in cell wall biosynthesis
MARPQLVFVSPLFLFPTDAGGKIRTTNILRGLKGGAFRIKLLSPGSALQSSRWRAELESLCDEFAPWQPEPPRPRWRRGLDLLGRLPVNVAADRTAPALAAVQTESERGLADLMVFDFVHASVLRPPRLDCKSVCFTHNVEAEIFARHAQQARDPARRWVWSSQHRKMVDYEGAALRGYDKVIAVSERDALHFGRAYGVVGAEAIPTGVDLDSFAWQPPPEASATPTVVFTGSMDAPANSGGVQWFVQQVWPRVVAALPQARFVVVGRNPPASLQALARRSANVELTGFVEDVRPHIRAAHVSVIPLLVGGGTRIKAFEAMALGSPVVSTRVGIEGLDVRAGEHFLEQDAPEGFADAVLRLLRDAGARNAMSRTARALVEERFGHRVAAQVFEDICLRTLGRPGARTSSSAPTTARAAALT